jgi:putative nucleotidyltransferase with HDIG domain
MSEEKQYITIELEKLRPDTLLGCNLYLRVNNNGQHILYKRKEMPVTLNDVNRLISNNVQCVFVDEEDEDIIMDYLESNLSYFLESEDIPLERKSELFYDCATHRVRDILSNPESSGNLKKSKAIVENAVNYIFSEQRALHSMMQLMSYDYHTYTHSVNVCTFCIALARFAGEKNKVVLKNIGLGALLHDVGKSRISEDILNKRGPLNEEEMALIKKHPIYGLEIVENMMPRSGVTALMVVQHHEKCDGSGYPYGKREGRIHFYSRMACVVDVFDALTTRRPYKDALSTFPAFRLMKDEMYGQLDFFFFNKFVQLLRK